MYYMYATYSMAFGNLCLSVDDSVSPVVHQRFSPQLRNVNRHLLAYLLMVRVDLVDASPTSNAPCSSQRLCQSAHIQNLAGCDAATVSCVCERGYDLDRGVCLGEFHFNSNVTLIRQN